MSVRVQFPHMVISILNALLLYSFSVPIVMRYRILPVIGTPYWLFGILFFVLSIHVLLSIARYSWLGVGRRLLWQEIFTWVTIAIVLGGTVVTAIVDRSKTAPVYGVHDIILQQEAAMRFLIEGKNPYKETYFGTPLESWHYDESGSPATNPALYHFVMPPWYLLFPFSIYAFALPILGYFDGRMVLLVAMVASLLVIRSWFTNRSLGLLCLTLVALGPATVDYFIEGRSDAFALFWLILALFLVEKKRVVWSAAVFALAILSKQTIWMAIPYYFLLAWRAASKNRTMYLRAIGVFVIAVGVIAGPFLWWDARAFMESVVLYVSGGAKNSYPISGYGLGMVLWSAGVIRDIHAYYPFILWQLGFGLPTLVFTIRWVRGRLTSGRSMVAYACLLTVVWYASRYFNNSHLSYLAWVFTIGMLRYIDETKAYEMV